MRLKDLFQKKKAEFHLENVVEQNKVFPRTFLMPPVNAINALKIGSLVKLTFVFEKKLANGCNAERMWVEITDINEDKFTGVIDNDPFYLKTIKCGDAISFEASNIAGIYSEKSTLNEDLFAIITKKALKYKQINRAIRTDDIENEQDSGWQLFYGDESESYLSDIDNASIVSLEDVLTFEPLLEEVFRSTGIAFEYSKDLNKFFEI